MTKVVTVVGTRPEIIRLSRVIARLDHSLDHILVHTGQNWDYELNDGFFDELKIRRPDHVLGIDVSSLGQVLGQTLIKVEKVLEQEQPDAMLVLGDTNSCVAAVMAKRMHIPVYHMESGNRCFDANTPEETNRRLIDHVADFNLVYTEHARRNLLAEGLSPRRISLTGSPMAEVLAAYRDLIDSSDVLHELDLKPGGYVLTSAHREENVDDPDRLSALLRSLQLAREEFGCEVLVSTHPRTKRHLEGQPSQLTAGLRFHRPFGFGDYVQLQRNAHCVLSDSGTISEEAAILGFPAVTLRESIERPESLDTGSIVMSGINPAGVIEAVRLVTSQRAEGDPLVAAAEYRITNCSQRVVNFIVSTASRHHAWAGIRRSGKPPVHGH